MYLRPTRKELSGQNIFPSLEFQRAIYPSLSGVLLLSVNISIYNTWWIQDNLEMNPTTPLHEDTLINLPPETPHQEVQRCTRNSPCRLSGCTICPTPTNHVRNLDEELETGHTSPTPPTSSNLPLPPPNHPILLLSIAFKNAIKEALSKQFVLQLEINLEFATYDTSDLATCYQTAEDIINAHTTVVAAPPPLPSSTTNLLLVSNLLSSIHRPGAANLGISTPGCQTS